MTINTIPISQRSAPWQGVATANGGYTLPQHAYIPHPVLQQIATGTVLSPTLGGQTSAAFAVPAGITSRPYPSPTTTGAWAIRQAQFKGIPAANA